jgi:hypothetical protein
MAQQRTKSKPSRLAVEYLASTSLTANPKNAGRHSSMRIAKLTSSLRNFGFNGAILVDENGEIMAGHTPHQGVLRLRLDQVQSDRNPSADAANGDLKQEG